MSRKTTGFTLVELLVLIAIVAILATILFPFFSRARMTARDKTCLNNIHQLSTAVLMYAEDNDGCAPGVEHPYGYYTSAGVRNEYVAWEVIIEPYLPSLSILTCPGNPDWCIAGTYSPEEPCLYGVPVPPSWYGVSVGYGMNTLLQMSATVGDETCSWFNWYGMEIGELAPSAGWGGQNLARLSKPALVMLICDANALGESCSEKINWPNTCTPPATYEGGDGCWDEGSTELQDPIYARHNGGNSWAFADGHARWQRSGLYMCADGSFYIDDSEIIKGTTMQKLHGVDQLN